MASVGRVGAGMDGSRTGRAAEEWLFGGSRVFGIAVHDHLIAGRGHCASLRRKGPL